MGLLSLGKYLCKKLRLTSATAEKTLPLEPEVLPMVRFRNIDTDKSVIYGVTLIERHEYCMPIQEVVSPWYGVRWFRHNRKVYELRYMYAHRDPCLKCAFLKDGRVCDILDLECSRYSGGYFVEVDPDNLCEVEMRGRVFRLTTCRGFEFSCEGCDAEYNMRDSWCEPLKEGSNNACNGGRGLRFVECTRRTNGRLPSEAFAK